MFKFRRPILNFTKFFLKRARPTFKVANFSSMEGKRATEATAGSISIPLSGKIGGAFKLSPNPAFAEERSKLFEELYQKQKKILESREKREIDITLPDGKIMKGTCWETTPFEIAKKISKKLAEVVVAAQIVYSKKDDSEFGGSKFKKSYCIMSYSFLFS